MSTMTQIIFDGCDQYRDVADYSDAITPQWPVQDECGRWHHEAFPDQRVVYTPRAVHFGFLAVLCEAPTDTDDTDGLYIVGRNTYRAAA